eukprot:TRINITY_DN36133_c0_g1_i1.p1 TRINITY_DN36133_c0_g1~~TRINITY_DN36133_c0_g1_i1.p1  ORF type:complete len:138 (+),score=13.60 TRINITY_DN36133_c0_g1_i1:4-417(+)
MTSIVADPSLPLYIVPSPLTIKEFEQIPRSSKFVVLPLTNFPEDRDDSFPMKAVCPRFNPFEQKQRLIDMTKGHLQESRAEIATLKEAARKAEARAQELQQLLDELDTSDALSDYYDSGSTSSLEGNAPSPPPSKEQ